MKRFYEKHELLFTVLLIVIYVISNSYCMNNFGMINYKTAIINIGLSLIILIFILKNGLGKHYGITKFPRIRGFLLYIPLIMIVSVNFWGEVNLNNLPRETIIFMVSMIGVGFLEEIIFRGFLFKMMEKDNVKLALLVSALTFGIGHIINLFNGAELIPTLIQICYSVSIGYLFALIFHKGKSLWPCIIAHSLINAFSIFNNTSYNVTTYVIPAFLIIVSVFYSMYIKRNVN